MLRIALPDAIAMYFIKNKFGKQLVDQHLEKKEDRYKKGRGNEPNIEPPLLYANGIDYLEENKGSIELYHLMWELGSFRFNQILGEWARDNALKPVTFKDLYERFIQQLPEDQRAKIRKKFETVEH